MTSRSLTSVFEGALIFLYLVFSFLGNRCIMLLINFLRSIYEEKFLFINKKEISFVKNTFTQYLKDKLEVVEVQGPILSRVGDGMQDNLSGVENAVSVKVLQIPDATYEVVHSLAKWKRHTLARFGFGEGEGLFVHMKALRPDEDSLDATHSVYVDQWDWEKVIPNGQRNIAYLKETVEKIYKAIRLTELAVEARL